MQKFVVEQEGVFTVRAKLHFEVMADTAAEAYRIVEETEASLDKLIISELIGTECIDDIVITDKKNNVHNLYGEENEEALPEEKI